MLLIRRVTAVVILLLLAGCALQLLPPASSTNPLELPPAGLPNGVAAGDVTQSSVVLWARAAETGIVTFTVQSDAQDAAPLATVTRTVVEPLLPVTATLAGLLPDTSYRYTAEVANGD